MRLNEIWDPSMYRAGDDRNPRSPNYGGHEIDPESEEFETQFQWYLSTPEEDEIPVDITGTVIITTEYQDYFPTRRRSDYDEEDGRVASDISVVVKVKQVNVQGTSITGQQAAQHFGEEQFTNFEDEFASEAIKGVISDDKPQITKWTSVKIELE